jgi:hypothetical protein
MRRIILILSFFLATTAGASWRVLTGGYSTGWHTTGGHHGHDVECPPEEQHDRCESDDFARANLDNSIGFRLGAEQRRNWLVYGAELNVISTEYNISQRDFDIAAGVATAGAVTEFFNVTLGLRGGAGLAATDDGHFGGVVMAEGSAEVPLNGAVAVRVAYLQSTFLLSGGSLRMHDTAFVFVFSDTPDTSQWRFGAHAGVSFPGLPVGDDLDLSHAPFTRLTIARRLSDRSAVGVSYLTAAHESTEKSVFMGFPDNERGKTITGIGVDWTTEVASAPRWFVELGAGAEFADWSDDHQLLPEQGGIEIAPMARVSLGIPLAQHLAIVITSEHLYWTGISLGESRLAIGVSSR